MRRLALTTLAVILLATGSRAADYFRMPPPPEVYQKILGRGSLARETSALYQEARLVKKSPDKLADRAWLRRVKALIMILACTDRRADAKFIAKRLLDGLHDQRHRNLFQIADLYNLQGFIRFSEGFRVAGEARLRHAVAYGNRNRGDRLQRSGRDAYFMGGLLRSLDYRFLAKILDDQGKAFFNMQRGRKGRVRVLRESEQHERRPALVFRTVKEELVKVDQARLAYEEAEALLPRVHAHAAQSQLSIEEFMPTEDAVLEMVKRLSEERKYMKRFIFELRRSSDLKVMDLREQNIEDFRDLRDDLQERQQELMAHLLIARFRNAL